MALHHPPFPCKIKTECKKLLLCFVFGWLAIVYITFKPYPMDYVDGKLLVDPQRMMVDGYGDIALLIAFPAARYIEKRWIRFEATGVKAKGIVICSVGMILLWAMLTFLGDPLDDMLGRCWGHFVSTTLTVFYCIAIYPLIIRLSMGKTSAERAIPGFLCNDDRRTLS